MKLRDYCYFPEDWHSLLDKQMLLSQNDSDRQKVYICSPCRADTPTGVYRNMMTARFYMFYAYKIMGLYPRAPHAYLPVLLNDGDEYERSMALIFGKDLLLNVKEVLVCGYILSEGMRGEITRALELGIPVTVYSSAVYAALKEATDSPLLRFACEKSPLELGPRELFESEEGL